VSLNRGKNLAPEFRITFQWDDTLGAFEEVGMTAFEQLQWASLSSNGDA
jgi:hypothetical protein